jgi:hypothetical protein
MSVGMEMIANALFFENGGTVMIQDSHFSESEAEFIQHALHLAAEKGDWLQKVLGQWPGDETIDELMDELERRKRE